MNDDSTQAMLDTVNAFKDRVRARDDKERASSARVKMAVISLIAGITVGVGVTYSVIASTSESPKTETIPSEVFDWIVLEIASNRDILPQAARRLISAKVAQFE